MAKINAIRGMNDILPSETPYWQYLEKTFRQLVQTYCYQEIRTPIVEQTSLFVRSIGEATDIVEKETYTFADRNGDSLTLRPEGTAGTVRAGIENSLFYNQVQRIWYNGPLFRHERPQKGRYRQFFQFGIEAFGMPGPDIDIEILTLTWRLWQMLGLDKHTRLHINSLGTTAERAQYRKKLVEYFSEHKDILDADSLRRLEKNPLRILDSKNPDLKSIIKAAPSILEELGAESKQHFEQICAALDTLEIPYVIDKNLVRGLDYYCHEVFEWITDDLGAQGTLCAGGRYDGLVPLLGGDDVPAVGCAMGIERILLMLRHHGLEINVMPDVYIISDDGQARIQASLIAENLHTQMPSLKILQHCGAGSFKSQMKKADKSGAKIALIIGESELANKTVSIKNLRERQEQQNVAQAEINEQLKTIFN